MKYKIAFLLVLLALMSSCATPCGCSTIWQEQMFLRQRVGKEKKRETLFLFNKHLKFYYND